MSGVDLGVASKGRVEKPSGLCQALVLPVRAPAGDGPVRPQPAGMERTGGDLDEGQTRLAGFPVRRRNFRLLPRGLRGRQRRSGWYCRRFSVGRLRRRLGGGRRRYGRLLVAGI